MTHKANKYICCASCKYFSREANCLKIDDGINPLTACLSETGNLSGIVGEYLQMGWTIRQTGRYDYALWECDSDSDINLLESELFEI